jgi:hypothetical protein
MQNKKNKYLILIPDLVSLEFDNEKSRDTLFETENKLYGLSNEKLKFHFSIKNEIDHGFYKDIKNSKIFESYGTGLSKNNIFWCFKKINSIQMKFIYDTRANIFYFEEHVIYKKIFSNVTIGEFYSARDLIRNIIYVTLFLNGYTLLPGMAFVQGNKNTFVAIIPRENGKTGFIIDKIKNSPKGFKYISENQILINLSEQTCFPTPPLWAISKGSSKGIFHRLTEKNDLIAKNYYQFSKLFFLINEKNSYGKEIYWEDFFSSNVFSLFSSLVINDYILFTSLGKEILKMISQNIDALKKMEKEKRIVVSFVNNYDYRKFTE